MTPDLLQRAVELQRRHRPYVLATVVWSRRPTSGRQGSHAIIEADGTVHGWIGGACAEPTVLREARRVLSDGEPKLIHLGPEDELDAPLRADVLRVPIACASDGALEVFMEPVLPQPHVVLVGRSPAVRTLAKLLAGLDWRATVVHNPPSAAPFDSGGLAPPSARGEPVVHNPPSAAPFDSGGLAPPSARGEPVVHNPPSAARFDSGGLAPPSARGEPVVDDPPSAASVVGSIAEAGVDDTTAVVVATQGHDDEAALEAALATDAAWIGLVASRARGETLLGYLRDRGFGADDLARIHTPAGLDLGRIEHREIGVAILAELVARKTTGELGQATGRVAGDAPATATDPVCGMTVEVATARHTSTYEGRQVVFCCPACQRRFDEDPARYERAGSPHPG